MSVVETTTESWGSRLGGALKGILFGIVLVLLAIGLLFWNEGRAVKRAGSLAECRKVTVSVPADRIDPQNNGKPVHTTGKALVRGPELADPLFPAVKVKAISLQRKVEMYQWQEHSKSNTKKNTGGSTTTTTTYTYSMGWSSSLIDSTSFKEKGHDNPAQMPVEAAEFAAAEVTLGAFRAVLIRAQRYKKRCVAQDVFERGKKFPVGIRI